MKKYLLALAVVIAMAGVAVANVYDDPHNPASADSDVDVKIDSTIVVTSADFAGDQSVSMDFGAMILDASFDSVVVSFDKTTVRRDSSSDVTAVAVFTVSADSAQAKSADKLSFTIKNVDTNKFTSAYMRAKSSDSFVSGGTTYPIVSGEWHGAPVVSLDILTSRDAKITVNKPGNFFSENPIVLAKTTPVHTGGSSSSGCNVGFAPMALLLGLPLFFLKK
ncbi:Synerg-CTERM sorting domain-containing protein [Dethiosulfovibrio salsuginis]|uniref:Synergist-CTERM protein sorting domain-containing protein n=1 Tax=Dethiosulfovibrio salsuginis TaxID=561720 RepID=A0A1X7IPL5_9BACT|nr:Synerg-CTERM sorting domain-containing protein [Dethiosulfovibrio salsuginis]SMG16638.1 Synergist-CTERM protein sorting domain-containing protein [Dethiosulfovibrio salsuginis]